MATPWRGFRASPGRVSALSATSNCLMECPGMAKECAACAHFYHGELDCCPNCGVTAVLGTVPTPRIRGSFVEDSGGWAWALGRPQSAALAPPVTEAWLVHANSG